MREQYLPSVCQLHAAIYNNEISVPKSDILLKQNEVTTLQYLIAQLLFFSKGNQEILDRYFVGYSIPQLGNEFDLLRFGENVVVKLLDENGNIIKGITNKLLFLCFSNNSTVSFSVKTLG